MTSLALTLPLFERLQVDLDAPAVQRRVGAVDADERRQALHRRVSQDHLRQRLLAFGHGGERDGLRRLGNAQDDAGVLHREEALGNDDVEQHRDDRAWPTATISVAVWCRSTQRSVRP